MKKTLTDFSALISVEISGVHDLHHSRLEEPQKQ